jgi:hypothetical protein
LKKYNKTGISFKGGLKMNNFKNKSELIDYVKKQTNIELKNEDILLNKKRNILYTEIPKNRKTFLLSFLNEKGIKYIYHVDDYYWIYVKA